MSQATRFAEIDEGPLTDWVIEDESVECITKLFNFYKPHLNILRECVNQLGCWGTNDVLGTDTYSFTLNDGTNIFIDAHSSGLQAMYNAFGVTRDGLCQGGQDNDSPNCTKTGTRGDCTAKILREGTIKF